jgi:hypothetical protein
LVRVLGDWSQLKIPYQRGFSYSIKFLMVDQGIASRQWRPPLGLR